MKAACLCVPIVVILLVCAVAEGADWIPFAESNIGTAYYDRAGVKKIVEDVFRISVKYVYSADGISEFRKAFAGVGGTQRVSYSLYVYEVDCYMESFKLMTAATYDEAGVVIKGTELDLEKTGQSAFEHVTPNSMMERLLSASCRWQLNAE
jgi:hypothetical protein